MEATYEKSELLKNNAHLLYKTSYQDYGSYLTLIPPEKTRGVNGKFTAVG